MATKPISDQQVVNILDKIVASQYSMLAGGPAYCHWLSRLHERVTQEVKSSEHATVFAWHYLLCWLQIHGYEASTFRQHLVHAMGQNLPTGITASDDAEALWSYPLNVSDDLLRQLAELRGVSWQWLERTGGELLDCETLAFKQCIPTWLCDLSWRCHLAKTPACALDFLGFSIYGDCIHSQKVRASALPQYSQNDTLSYLALQQEFEHIGVLTWYEDLIWLERSESSSAPAKVEVSMSLFRSVIGRRVLKYFEQLAAAETPAMPNAPVPSDAAVLIHYCTEHLASEQCFVHGRTGKRMNMGKIMTRCAATSLALMRAKGAWQALPLFHDSSIERPSAVAECQRWLDSKGFVLTPETLYKAHLELSKFLKTDYWQQQLPFQRRFLYPHLPWYELIAQH